MGGVECNDEARELLVVKEAEDMVLCTALGQVLSICIRVYFYLHCCALRL